MHKILLPRNTTYKEGPQIRENGRATQDAPEDKAQGPPVNHLEEGGSGAAPCGVGRPQWLGRTQTSTCLGAFQGGVAPKLPHGRG